MMSNGGVNATTPRPSWSHPTSHSSSFLASSTTYHHHDDTMSHQVLPTLEDDWSSATFLTQLRDNINNSTSASATSSTRQNGASDRQRRALITQSFRELFFPHQATSSTSGARHNQLSSNTAQQRARVLLAPLFSNRLVEDLDEAVRVPWTQCHKAILHDVTLKLNSSDSATSSSSGRFLPSESQFAASLMEHYYPNSASSALSGDADDEDDSDDDETKLKRLGGGLLSASGVHRTVSALNASWDAWDEIVERNTHSNNTHNSALLACEEQPHDAAAAAQTMWMLRGAIRSRLHEDMQKEDEVVNDDRKGGGCSSAVVRCAATSLEMDLATSASLNTATLLTGGAAAGDGSHWSSVAGAIPAWMGTLCCPALVAPAKRMADPLPSQAAARHHHHHQHARDKAFDPAEMAQRSLAASSAWYNGSSVAHPSSAAHGAISSSQYDPFSTHSYYAAGKVVPMDAVVTSVVYSSGAGTVESRTSRQEEPRESAERAWLTSQLGSSPSDVNYATDNHAGGGGDGRYSAAFTMPTEDEVEEDSALARALRVHAAEDVRTTDAPSARPFDGNGASAVERQQRGDDGVVQVGAHQRLVFRRGQLVLEHKNPPPKGKATDTTAKRHRTEGKSQFVELQQEIEPTDRTTTTTKTRRTHSPTTPVADTTSDSVATASTSIAEDERHQHHAALPSDQLAQQTMDDEVLLSLRRMTLEEAQITVQVIAQRWGPACASLCDALKVGLDGL
ncbi:Hypothetical protein, putative [Bodo saltans]|uniref:Uncharacterized protein n=1 Tax=Bodo saltans TaxID=75058 RepID=A0A0S4J5P3_BODSA|nr:Hypothetical protein, putative [Bodo saltans]|eukprot:CUG85213.1 Hypothetical protein, putative [Bodo saltans]